MVEGEKKNVTDSLWPFSQKVGQTKAWPLVREDCSPTGRSLLTGLSHGSPFGLSQCLGMPHSSQAPLSWPGPQGPGTMTFLSSVAQ